VASLLLMGGSTVAIAFLPTYAMAGWIAPFLLCLLRFGQGFGLGGEWGGAALLAVENAPPGWRARFGMFPQLGAPVGFIAANGLFLILGVAADARSSSWPGAGACRSWAAIILVGPGPVGAPEADRDPGLRRRLPEAPPPVPLVEVAAPWRRRSRHLRRRRLLRPLLPDDRLRAGLRRHHLGYARETFLASNWAPSCFMAAASSSAGYWADATTPRKVLMAGCPPSSCWARSWPR
jgi:MFS family permease